MRVRDLKSNTIHGKVGRLERGFFRDIDPANYSHTLFEIIPQSSADIVISCVDPCGYFLSDKKIAALREKKFKDFNKKVLPQYEEENKLAVERLNGRK